MIRAWLCLVALTAASAAGAMGVGCGSSTPALARADAGAPLTRLEMLQPTNCVPCHKSHFDDWTESMHAQASDDPVFIAMNKRGQRETNGKLGTFCVKCHAPMAVRDGMTPDGLNLGMLPTYYKGVTCFFCHTINSVNDNHNNASVNLADDLVMRGELQDPPAVVNPAHASAYSTFHDDQKKDSAVMCGSCHDIKSPAGGDIERTFIEWSNSAFSVPGPKGFTCSFSSCHMSAAPVPVVVGTGGPKRSFHPHNFPAVDVSLQANTVTTSGAGTFPEAGDPTDSASSMEGGETPAGEASSPDGAQTADAGAATDAGSTPADAATSSPTGGVAADGGLPGMVAVQNALNSTVLAGALCVNVNSQIRVILDTVGVGHHWPSGAAQDRRAWAEVIAYDASGNVIYSSGVVPDGTPVTSIKDPDLWLLRDCMFDAKSRPVVNFWEAANVNGYELPAMTTFDPTQMGYYANHIVQSFPRDPSAHLPERPARVTLRMRIQPIGIEVLQDLVASQDLDPSIVAKMPTFDVSLQGPGGDGFPPPGGLEWTPASTDTSYKDFNGPGTCAASPSFNPTTATTAQSAAICKPPSQ
jgi:Cytochrome c554 and c-prime